MAASIDLQEHANFTRLSRLLIDKGTEALRITLDAIHPPANLPAVLYANKKSFLRLKYRVINDLQWDLLFPSTGQPPDSKKFDVTLLTVLFRNICWPTHSPKYWKTMPPDTDRTSQANVARVKLFRNEVYAHVTSTRVDEATFESLWQKISQALVDLNISRKEIHDLKISALGPEEESYVQKLKEWCLHDENSKNMLRTVMANMKCLKTDVHSLTTDMQHLTEIAEGNSQILQEWDKHPERATNEELILQKLAKHNFRSIIAHKVKSFHPGTREWLLKQLDEWFTTDDESRLLLLTAGPGFGKSVFAAKVCELFRENGKLGAYHFCDFSNSNLKNPMMMLESLASHMCENVAGFKERLLDQMRRHHSVRNLNDAFQIYLQNPLNELQVEPFLIVIDGLDESASNEKSNMVKLIAVHFPELPKCVKVLVTGRPELSLQKLDCVKKIEIAEDDEKNELDLRKYLKDCLPILPQFSGDIKEDGEDYKFYLGEYPVDRFPLYALSDSMSLSTLIERFKWYQDQCIFSIFAKKCEGSFLYAFHIQHELCKRRDLDTMTLKEIIAILPQGLGSVYQEYFHRLDIELEAVMKKETNLFKILELLVATNKCLPLTFVARTLDLDLDCRDAKRIIGKVNNAVSCLLYVSNDLVTVFHKSVRDWLLAEGYEDHEYAVKVSGGKKQLWLLCQPIFEDVKENVMLGNDLKLTNEVKYALENGYDYLVSSNLAESFGWLVDVVIVHFCLNKLPHTLHSLKKALHKVLTGDAAISLQLRRRILWHIGEMCRVLVVRSSSTLSSDDLAYLENVIYNSPKSCFTESEIEIAKLLMAKASQGVKSDLNGATPFLIPCLLHLQKRKKQLVIDEIFHELRVTTAVDDLGESETWRQRKLTEKRDMLKLIGDHLITSQVC